MTFPHEKIAQIAYRLWEESGRAPGRDKENWEEAIRYFESLPMSYQRRIVEEHDRRHEFMIRDAVADGIRDAERRANRDEFSIGFP